MRAHRVIGGINEFLDMFASAVAVSAAVNNRQPARTEDLRRLGIDPVRFRQIGRR